MADFIEVSEITDSKDGYEQTNPRLLSKYYITAIVPDERHNQTFINYYKDEEIRVRETAKELLAKFQE